MGGGLSRRSTRQCRHCRESPDEVCVQCYPVASSRVLSGENSNRGTPVNANQQLVHPINTPVANTPQKPGEAEIIAYTPENCPPEAKILTWRRMPVACPLENSELFSNVQAAISNSRGFHASPILQITNQSQATTTDRNQLSQPTTPPRMQEQSEIITPNFSFLDSARTESLGGADREETAHLIFSPQQSENRLDVRGSESDTSASEHEAAIRSLDPNRRYMPLTPLLSEPRGQGTRTFSVVDTPIQRDLLELHSVLENAVSRTLALQSHLNNELSEGVDSGQEVLEAGTEGCNQLAMTLREATAVLETAAFAAEMDRLARSDTEPMT